MSNYIKATNFASKDALSTGNALKTVSGTEIDDEYTAIATAVATKANTASPTLTGTPAAPTASASTTTTQVATTAFTQAAITAGITAKAPLASPALTGTPTAPTASASTNTTQLATTAYTTTAIAAIPAVTAAVVNALAYPVGAIYTSIVSTNPATTLGVGTWTAFGAGRVLVGLNASDSDFDTVEETGGAKTDAHTLTTSEIPSHTHASGWRLGGGDGSATHYATDHEGSYINTGSTGGGAAHTHDIVQPYIVVYFWKRTA
jgi:hypothetical protein